MVHVSRGDGGRLPQERPGTEGREGRREGGREGGKRHLSILVSTHLEEKLEHVQTRLLGRQVDGSQPCR